MPASCGNGWAPLWRVAPGRHRQRAGDQHVLNMRRAMRWVDSTLGLHVKKHGARAWAKGRLDSTLGLYIWKHGVHARVEGRFDRRAAGQAAIESELTGVLSYGHIEEGLKALQDSIDKERILLTRITGKMGTQVAKWSRRPATSALVMHMLRRRWKPRVSVLAMCVLPCCGWRLSLSRVAFTLTLFPSGFHAWDSAWALLGLLNFLSPERSFVSVRLFGHEC